MGATTQRRRPAPPEPPPVQVSSNQAKHWSNISDYNAKIKAMQAAGKYTADNAPYASPTTAPPDLNKMIRNSGMQWDGPMPAEEGLHSGSGAVDVFNRPQPQTLPGQGSATTTTVLPQTQPSAGIGASTRSASRVGASTRDASAIDTTAAAPRTAPDGTAYAPHIAQLIGAPLPPDVAQTVLAQNRAASQPSATPVFLGASSRYASNGNFDTQQAVNDYAKGNLTPGQLSAVYDDASAATRRQGAGILPATQAADAASRRQPGGSPYGMVPVDPSQQGQTYVGDGVSTFNGQVLPKGQTLTLLPGGRKIIGSVAATMQVPGAPVAVTPATPPAPVTPSAPNTPAPSPQVVAASNTNAEAFQNQDFNRESATGPIAQAAQARVAPNPSIPQMDPADFTPGARAVRATAAAGDPTSAIQDFQNGSTLSPVANALRAFTGAFSTGATNANAQPVTAPVSSAPARAVAGAFLTGATNANTQPVNAPLPGQSAQEDATQQAAIDRNARLGLATPTAPDGSPLAPHVANTAALPAAPFTTAASQALARPGTTTNSTGDPVSDAAIALDRPTDASQNLARPGQQTDTSGPVSDAFSTLNRRTDASQALNNAPTTAQSLSAAPTAAQALQGATNASQALNGPTGAALALQGATPASMALRTPTAAASALGGPTDAASSLSQAANAAAVLNRPTDALTALTGAPAASTTLNRPTDAGLALNKATDTSQALNAAPSAAQVLNRPTGASLALNPAAPTASVTPAPASGFMNGYVGAVRGQSLNDPASLSLTGTATNNGATDFSGTRSQLPAGNVTSSLGDDFATPAGVAKSDPANFGLPKTAPNPNAGAGTPDDGTPLGDDEEMVNGIRKKKLQSSTSPAPPGPSQASGNNSAPAAPSGSGGSDS